MIIDNLSNINRFKDMQEIHAALIAIKNNQVNAENPLLQLSETITIKEENVVTQQSETKEYESHKKFLDIHYVAGGVEKSNFF